MSHTHNERSADWYWALGIITLVAAGACVWFGNALFAAILVLGAGSIGILAARGPREHNVRIDGRGISIDGTMHLYRDIHTFWVDHSEEPRLYLTTSSLIMPRLSLPLEGRAQGDQIRSMLHRFVKEEEQEPRFSEIFTVLLGL